MAVTELDQQDQHRPAAAQLEESTKMVLILKSRKRNWTNLPARNRKYSSSAGIPKRTLIVLSTTLEATSSTNSARLFHYGRLDGHPCFRFEITAEVELFPNLRWQRSESERGAHRTELAGTVEGDSCIDPAAAAAAVDDDDDSESEAGLVDHR